MTDQTGLTIKEVKEREKRYGRNEITAKRKGNIKKHLKNIFSEPIYLLLSISAFIYFVLGDAADGFIMIMFVVFVIGIDRFQDLRTGNVLKKLKDITTPRVEVIREGKKYQIGKEELVPGDLVLLQEGAKIPADGHLISCAGLWMDESILTGESIAVKKEAIESEHYNTDAMHDRNICCYTGTLVVLGSGRMIVDCIGNDTEYGKIAESIASMETENSLLQRQLKELAKQCLYFASILFILVSGITYLNLYQYTMSERIIHSMLAGIVLALSMVPGEFPVILSVYFSMGALRLVKKKALVRRLSSVETLGAVSVLCMDKTGTITENCMQVSEAFIEDRQESRFCQILSLACRRDTSDSVEEALLDYGKELCKHCCNKDSRNEKEYLDTPVMACDLSKDQRQLILEYSFTNEMKAMGQLWFVEGKRIIAAKGSPEAILRLCSLQKKKQLELQQKLLEYSGKGRKVIAIADTELEPEEEAPERLEDCRLQFRGLIALADPPRATIPEGIQSCYLAGMRIIMITGDHPITASTIAEQVGIENSHIVMSGAEIDEATEKQLREKVKECNIYARVLPEHKMRIVKALKENGEVVAMTGDGVNDSMALKIADIGIAMGKNGSEVSREAADLILMDDNFVTVLDTIADGRRIYQNIQKTIAYVLAFHIPIALICLIAPLCGIEPQDLLLMPLHIVLLEFVMDPTVSIALERQPAEPDIMCRPPRNPSQKLITLRAFTKSMLQGIAIFMASFFLYFGLKQQGYSIEMSRTCGFTVLVLSSMLLVLINCSEHETVIHTIYRLRSEAGVWLLNAVILFGLGILIYSPLHGRLGFEPLDIKHLLIVVGISLASVLWYEPVKMIAKHRHKQKTSKA